MNRACWFGAGMTVIGAGIAVVWPSATPDPIAFSGKSPEYIRAYTNAYKSRIKKTQTIFGMLGCATTLLTIGFIYAVIEINKGCNETNQSCTETNESSQESCNDMESCMNSCNNSSSGNSGE